MLYLGIDQHKRQLTVNLRDEEGQVLMRRQVSTRPAAVNAFLQDLRERGGADGYVAIVEVCGFNDWLIDLLPEFGCREVILVQPEKRSKRKTDRRDANKLGELLWVNRRHLLNAGRIQGVRRVMIPSAEQRDDRRLTAIRRTVAREQTRVINRIRHLLRRRNLEHRMPTKGIKTVQARAWLKTLELSLLDRFELDQLLEKWKLLDDHREQLEARLAERHAQSEDAPLIQSIPGAGDYGALALACRIGPIARFPRPRSLANYIGLTPTSRNSGESTQRLGAITKDGSTMVRFILGQMVVHVLRQDPAMRAWYGRIKRRRGSKIARVAVMRRLCVILWHMLTRREPYIRGGRVAVQRAHATAAFEANLPSDTAVERGEPSSCEGGPLRSDDPAGSLGTPGLPSGRCDGEGDGPPKTIRPGRESKDRSGRRRPSRPARTAGSAKQANRRGKAARKGGTSESISQG